MKNYDLHSDSSICKLFNSELYHYGVKGMKWGVRKDYDYSNGRTRFKYRSSNGIGQQVVRSIASVIPGGALLYNAVVIGQMSRNAYLNSDAKKNYFDIEGAPEKISALKKKTSKTSADDDMRAVNPNYGKRGNVKNCMLCTSAMEMRRRGYDVRARSTGVGFATEEFSKWFKGAKVESAGITRNPKESNRRYAERGYNNLCDKLESNGIGARGALTLNYHKGAMGHAMFWEVGSNGRVTIYDGQSNKKSGSKMMDRTLSEANPASYHYVRLDNCQLNDAVTSTVKSIDEGKR